MWNRSGDSLVERNAFIDCQRDIALGLDESRTPSDHSGGIIRNNFIVKTAQISGDAGISIINSPNTVAIHNTILQQGNYPNAIEY